MSLNHKVAIITGAGRGIGRRVALDLAKEGCNIVVTSRSEDELTEVVREATALGVRALGIPLDLSLEANVDQLVTQSVAHFGTIDFLINNAAILYTVPLLDTSLAQWDTTMSLNLRSVFILSQQVLRLMAEKRSGYIVNISSTVAHGVPQRVAAYGVSKVGLVGLSQALYSAGQECGVRVSTVYPGVTDTEMLRNNAAEGLGEPEDWMLPEDISYCVLFLLKQSPRMVVRDITPLSVKFELL